MNEPLKRVLLLVGLVVSLVPQGHGFADADPPGVQVFAHVNGEVIPRQSYETAVRVAGRQRFYHGKPPEADVIAFRKEVGQQLVDETLLHQEAVRRRIEPDEAWVEREFGKIEKRYSASPDWAEQGRTLREQIRERLARRSRVRLLEAQLREVPDPSEDALRAFYEANPDKFTSPEQVKVSSILLKVQPWEPSSVWQDAQRQADEILAALAEDPTAFDRLAARHATAPNTDMGYIHRGMLGETAQEAIDALETGAVSSAVTLLEGVAIFRLDERIPAQLNPLDKVRERAVGLLRRELSEEAYEATLASLRSAADVALGDPDYFQPPWRQGRPSQLPGETAEKAD